MRKYFGNEVDKVFERWENGDTSRFLSGSEAAQEHPWRDETRPRPPPPTTPRHSRAGGSRTGDQNMDDCETLDEDYQGDQIVKENLEVLETFYSGVDYKNIADWVLMLPAADSRII